MDAVTSLPFAWAFLILFVIVMLRSNATYWAGRGISAGGRKSKLQKYLNSPSFARAETFIAEVEVVRTSIFGSDGVGGCA